MGEVDRNIELFLDSFDGNITAGLDHALQAIENEAKEHCPVDDGTLRASITHQVDVFSGVVGTNVEYAPYVHEGTGIFAADGKGRQQVPWTYCDAEGNFHKTSGQKPNPFLRDAVDALQGQLLDLVKEGMHNGSN